MATLAGEAAIRIVPTLAGFKPEVDRRLKTMTFEPVKVQVDPTFTHADAEMDEWRARQRLNAVNVPVRADFQAFKRDLSQVEHIFKRNAFTQAFRLQIKIIGLDALPALAYAAGSAASGLDALAEAGLALPGILGGALASVGALAVGITGVSDAFKAFTTDSEKATKSGQDQAKAARDLEKSYRDYRGAVRDTIRSIQDLNAENRRSSLNVADAVLSVQEAADKLREGGQKSITELRRDQLSYVESLDHLQDVQLKAQRTAQDAQQANADGVQNADAVVSALDRIADAQDRISQKDSSANTFDAKLAKLAPNAQNAVKAVLSFKDAWTDLTAATQNNLFDGLDKTVTDLGNKWLPSLKIGLSGVASGLNSVFRSVGESLGSDTTKPLIERIFGDTKGGLENFSKAMNPLIEGVSRLTKESSDFLPRIGEAADKVFTRFDAWTEKISTNGQLDRWIDNGLKAVDSIGQAAINIGSIFQSIGKAFDEVSGHQGGFIKTLEDGTKKLADLLASPKGQIGLVQYFEQAKTFIGQITNAIKNMKPFLKEVADLAREWSTGFFAVTGALVKAADFIQRNTGLLGILFQTYLTIKTVKPLVDGLTNSWKNYNKVVSTAASANSPFRNVAGVQQAAIGLQRMRGEAVQTVREVARARAAAAATAASLTGPVLGPAAGGGAAVASVAALTPRQTLPPGLSTAQREQYIKSINGAGVLDPALARRINDYQVALVNSAHAADDAADAARRAAKPTEDLGNEAKKAGDNAKKSGESVAAAGRQNVTAAGQVRQSSSAMTSVSEAARTTTDRVRTLGDEARNTGERVGVAGGGIGLAGRLGGLAAGLGPGLALAAGITLITTLVTNLGEAHRRAAEKADQQRQALKNLSSQLDSTTGELTREGTNAAIKNFQGATPLGGNVDDNFQVWAALQRLGLNPRDAIVNAGAPNLAPQFEQQQGKLIGDLKNQIGGTQFWRDNEKKYADYGLDLDTVAKAAGGDQAALQKLNAAVSKQKFVTAPGGRAAPVPLPPDLGQLGAALPNKDLLGVTQKLQAFHDEQIATGNQNIAVSQQTDGGKRGLSQAAQAALGPFGVDANGITVESSGEGRLHISTLPPKDVLDKLAEQGITVDPVKDVTDNFYNVRISPERTDELLPRNPSAPPGYASGGLIGGVGGPTDDANLAMVSRGEHIARAKAVDYYGVGLFDDLNNMRIPRDAVGLAGGGWRFPPPLSPAAPTPSPGGGLADLFPNPAAPSSDVSDGASFFPSILANLGGGLTGLPVPPLSPPGAVPTGPAVPPPAATAPTASAPAVTTPPSATSTPAATSDPIPGHSDPAWAPVDAPAQSSSFQSGVNYANGLPVGPGGTAPALSGQPYGLPVGTNIGYGQAGFPDWVYSLDSQYGVESSTYARHQEKSGENKGIDFRPSGLDINTPEGAARMDQFAQAMINTPGVEQVIWENPFTHQRFGKDPGDRGANQSIDDYYRDDWKDHTDHVHVRTSQSLGGGSANQLTLLAQQGDPQALALLQSNGLLPGGGKEKNVQSPLEFLSGLASNVGGTLTQIGLSFLDGITGINFSGIAGIGQSITNGLLDLGVGSKEDTGANNIAGQGISDYLNGQAGLSPELQAMLQKFGLSSDTSSLNGPGNLSDPKQAVHKAMLDAGFPESEWPALQNLVQGESGFRPTVKNPSSGAYGLFQFLGHENDQYGALGGYSSDPYAQAVAGMQYIKDRYGTPTKAYSTWSSRSPHWYANGGSTEMGPAWLSRGEYRTSAAATKYYGPGLFDALNGMTFPKFKRGGWPGYKNGGPVLGRGSDQSPALAGFLRAVASSGLPSTPTVAAPSDNPLAQVSQARAGVQRDGFADSAANQFVTGAGTAAGNAVVGTAQAIAHPIDTAQALAPLVGAGGAGAPGVGESWQGVGKAVTHWDEWQDNPWQALGGSAFDIGTLATGVPGAIRGGARVAEAASAAATNRAAGLFRNATPAHAAINSPVDLGIPRVPVNYDKLFEQGDLSRTVPLMEQTYPWERGTAGTPYSTAQENQILAYTDGSGKFNKPLWGGQEPYSDTRSRIDDLTSALDAAPRLPEDAILLHHFNEEALSSLGVDIKSGTIEDRLQQYVGKILHQPGFTSTSLQPKEGFGDFQARISAPAGTRGAYVSSSSGLNALSRFGRGEQEFLLQRGRDYAVEHAAMAFDPTLGRKIPTLYYRLLNGDAPAPDLGDFGVGVTKKYGDNPLKSASPAPKSTGVGGGFANWTDHDDANVILGAAQKVAHYSVDKNGLDNALDDLVNKGLVGLPTEAVDYYGNVGYYMAHGEWAKGYPQKPPSGYPQLIASGGSTPATTGGVSLAKGPSSVGNSILGGPKKSLAEQQQQVILDMLEGDAPLPADLYDADGNIAWPGKTPPPGYQWSSNPGYMEPWDTKPLPPIGLTMDLKNGHLYDWNAQFADPNSAGANYWKTLFPRANEDQIIELAMGYSPEELGLGSNPLGRGFANGGLIRGPGNGTSDSIPIRASDGEFMMSADAVRNIGVGALGAMNAGHFDGGGWPLLQPPPVPGAQGNGPLPGPPPPPPGAAGSGAPAPAATPGAGPGAPALAPPGAGQQGIPSTGGAPGPGATAPAPDPGATPQVGDALSAIGGLGQAIGAGGGQVGDGQPGADPANQANPRAVLGAAPASSDHNNPALSSGISGIASTIGGLASTAVSAAAAGASFGAGGAAGGAAGSLIAGGAQVAGDVVKGVANIFSSLLVGTATNGSTASASGVPLLPSRQQQTPVAPVYQKVHNGDVNVTSFDDLKRTQDRLDAQQQLPYINKYG